MARIQRAYYFNSVKTFCLQNVNEILGEISLNNEFALESKQRNTWVYEIELLKDALSDYPSGIIAFEYTIPRIGDRIDNVFLYNGIVYLIEFKVGEANYPRHAIDQVIDYALDLKYFHEESHNRKIVPIVVCTNAEQISKNIEFDTDGICSPICCNKINLKPTIALLTQSLQDYAIMSDKWLQSRYMPTPTIVEAAQALYRGHDVEEISRSDSEAYNLSLTTDTINRIINRSKANNDKSICFITGVPGAGKTLAGLNIANVRHNFDEDEHAVFLSGNGPLVYVLLRSLGKR